MFKLSAAEKSGAAPALPCFVLAEKPLRLTACHVAITISPMLRK
nr:MAG TPA: hypothetical protein [Caudoviricetes sp.]